MTTAQGITVVIPTYRRPELLTRCLQALARQTHLARLMEVIVCDDGPDISTRLAVETLAATTPYRLRYLAVTATQGPAAARNRGWEQSSYAIIAFTDDDTIPQPQWLEEGIKSIGCSLAVSGRILVPLPPNPTDYEKNEAGLEKAEFATANCFVRKEALEVLGGFDERFTAAWREDSDLHFRLLTLRGSPEFQRVVRSDNACVVHPVRPARWGASLGQQKKSLFNALLFAKHRALYRERIEPRAPVNYYAALVACVALIISGISGWRIMGLVSGFAWLGITAEFCARRLSGTSREASHVAEMVVTSILIPFVGIYWRLIGAWRFRVLFV